MLTELRVQNFKALRKLTVPLRPLTVLIGPNDSGKSSVLQALDALGRSTREGITSFFDSSFEQVVHRCDPSLTITLSAAGAIRTRKGRTAKFDYSVSFRDGRQVGGEIIGGGYQRLADLRALNDEVCVASDGTTKAEARAPIWNAKTALAKMSTQRAFPMWADLADGLRADLVRLDPERLAEPCPLPLGKAPMLDYRGFGLASVVDYLATGPDPRLREQLEADLARLLPTVKGVALKNVDVGGGQAGKALEFRLQGETPITIPAKQASDGALLATGYLALAYGSTTGRLLVDEPENGLHPSALGFVIDLVRRMTSGEVGGRERQVILTTHNPLLLNFVEPDEVLIVTRDKKGEVRITPITETEHFESRFEDYDLGELWYNIGEDVLVG